MRLEGLCNEQTLRNELFISPTGAISTWNLIITLHYQDLKILNN